mgnify:FL=1|jgi:hypothetical protein
MTEYQIFNLMHVGFIQNAMYFVGMVLFVWLGFRMANNIYNNSNANFLGKVFTSLFCILVAAMMFNVQQIGAAILGTAVTQLGDIGAASAERMQMYVDHPLGIGGTVQSFFVLLVVVFQLALVWSKK